jgi:peptide/nickel transport system substrate-binding protein
MPYDMAAVLIVSRKHGETAATEDYNSGKAMVGTGPYRFHSYTPNQQVTLKANFAYWGGEEPWETLTFKLLSNPAARVAALLSGDVQAIESVPSTDISTLGKSAQVELFSKISNRLIYLAPEQERDQAPFVTGKDGKPLAGNPLKDVRVRRAVSLALDRPAIAARVMEGKALPASQILPDGFPGVSRRLRPDKHDAAAARQLLAEAGYPNGFSLTLFATNNRYINDARIAQTIAQMLSRIGIDSKVEALPASVFFTRASKREFGIFMAGWGAETGEAASPLKALLATHNPAAGKGASNRMRYSNASFDATLTEALATIDPLKRESILARANEIAFSELGIIPVHHEISTWAVKRGIVMKPRVDQYTLAMDMRPR